MVVFVGVDWIVGIALTGGSHRDISLTYRLTAYSQGGYVMNTHTLMMKSR